ncbi:TadE/TadG family type IV pilus assembly protein [Bosea thiooxidans]
MSERKTETVRPAGETGLSAKSRDRRLFGRFRRSQDGAAAVEFGFVALPFVMLLWAIFETALMFWTNQVLEEALLQASRSVLTGQSRSLYTSTNAATNAAAFRDAVCARAPLGLIDCNKLSIDVRGYADFSAASSGTASSNPLAGGKLDTSSFSYSQPASGQIVVIRAVLDYNLFLTSWASASLANIGPGHRGLVASIAFRTEPFV